MATATLKLSDLELIYAQLNALRHHVGLFPLNPKEYILSVDGKEIVAPRVPIQAPSSSVALVVPLILPPPYTEPIATITPSSSVALVVPVIEPLENYTDNEEDEEDDEDEESGTPSLVPYDISSHSWVSGF